MGVVRMNITVPEDVVKILKKKTKPGEKSAYIAEAVRHYAQIESQHSLLRSMVRGYQATAAEDLEDNTEWDWTDWEK